jgi:hypothetical protein
MIMRGWADESVPQLTLHTPGCLCGGRLGSGAPVGIKAQYGWAAPGGGAGGFGGLGGGGEGTNGGGGEGPVANTTGAVEETAVENYIFWNL